MNKEVTNLLLYIMLSGIIAVGIWFIIDKDTITQIIGLGLFAIGLGSLFSLIAEDIVKEIKQQSKPGVEQ